jgi:hypothetical protein
MMPRVVSNFVIRSKSLFSKVSQKQCLYYTNFRSLFDKFSRFRRKQKIVSRRTDECEATRNFTDEDDKVAGKYIHICGRQRRYPHTTRTLSFYMTNFTSFIRISNVLYIWLYLISFLALSFHFN